MDVGVYGAGSIGGYTTWPKNDPNAVRLIFSQCCDFTKDRVFQYMYTITVKLYAFYDGLGAQYATPVIYADNNGVPGEKLTIDEPLIDLTCQSNTDNRWIEIAVPIKNRRINPGYIWVGIYSQSFRPCFNFPTIYSDGKPHYTMNAPNGYPPLTGEAVTVHPIGNINITGIFVLSDIPIPINFLYEINSYMNNTDTHIEKRNLIRKRNSIITTNEKYTRISTFNKKILQIIRPKENKGYYRFMHRFLFTRKRIRDYLFSKILRIKLEKILFSPITLIRFIREKIMNTVHVNQTALRLIVDTAIELGSGDVCEIRYCKPDGITGSFPASILTENTSLIFYDITSETELDKSGWWKFWAYITFADGRSACGKSVKMYIADEGS